MKKFWISLIALFLGVAIGVGIWQGIVHKDKIKVFADKTWSKIESLFKKDNNKQDEQNPTLNEEQFSLDGLYYINVNGDYSFVQIRDYSPETQTGSYGIVGGCMKDSQICLFKGWESRIEVDSMRVVEDDKYLHLLYQNSNEIEQIMIYDKASKTLYYDFSNGDQFPGETYEEQLLSVMTPFTEFVEIECQHETIMDMTKTHPTCTEAGLKENWCYDCNKLLGTETLPALGHNYVGGKCTRCGESDPNYVEACEHDWVEDLSYVPTAPSCGEYWDTQYKCSKCNETKLEKNGPLPHDWVDGVCSRCGTQCQHVHENGHICPICGCEVEKKLTWRVGKPATCTENGVEYGDCICGYNSEMREIPATGHTFDAGICTSCNALDEEFYNNFVGYWFTETTGFKKESFGKYYIQVYKDGDNYIFTRSGYKVENGEIVLYQNSTDYSNPETWTFTSTNRIIEFTLTRQDITFNGTYDGQTLVVGDMTFTKTDKPIRYDGSTSYVIPL